VSDKLGDVSASDIHATRIRFPFGASELKSSNDATIQDANIKRRQDSIAEVVRLLPAQLENFPLDTIGLASIMPLAHPLTIVYITSCLQDHHMLYVSPQIANLGFSPGACLGKPDLRLHQVYAEDAEPVAKAFRHSCATAATFGCQYRLYDKAGKLHWFHDEASVVCDESGTPLFIRGVMLDITDKKQMEAELAQHRYSLELNVEQRTAELLQRLKVLESCNSALCDKLAQARRISPR